MICILHPDIYPTVHINTIKKGIETMYNFINDYPYFRENGLSHECQGVCHDKDYWYFTQDGNIWKIPLGMDLNQKFDKDDRSLKFRKVGGHLGDLDYAQSGSTGYLFIPDMGNESETFISVWEAKTLRLVAKFPIYCDNKRFTSIGWCAINSGYLYTSESTVGDSRYFVHIYKIDSSWINPFMHPCGKLLLMDEAGNPLTLKDMQGGCFDNENHLHLANGFWKNEERDKQGIHIFEVQAVPGQQVQNVKRISKSNQKSGFKYKFDTSGQEPEGMTWWDLDKDPRAPAKERGQLHVIQLDNDPGDTDDLVFKHFRRTK